MIAQAIISKNRVHAGSICCSFRSLVVAHGRHHVRTRHTVSHRLRAFSMQTNDANAPQKDAPRKLPPVKRITRGATELPSVLLAALAEKSVAMSTVRSNEAMTKRRAVAEDVTIQFARSSGAGGQNVNKVNTKVDMRLHLGNASWLDREIADAVRRMEKKRINKDDELVVMSQRTRSQLYVFVALQKSAVDLFHLSRWSHSHCGFSHAEVTLKMR